MSNITEDGKSFLEKDFLCIPVDPSDVLFIYNVSKEDDGYGLTHTIADVDYMKDGAKETLNKIIIKDNSGRDLLDDLQKAEIPLAQVVFRGKASWVNAKLAVPFEAIGRGPKEAGVEVSIMLGKEDAILVQGKYEDVVNEFNRANGLPPIIGRKSLVQKIARRVKNLCIG